MEYNAATVGMLQNSLPQRLVQSFEPILVSTVCGTIQSLTPTSSIKIKVNQHIFEQQQQQKLTGMFNHSQQKWNPGR
jgi:hypothetical protein